MVTAPRHVLTLLLAGLSFAIGKETDGRHWAFRPIARTPLPKIASEAWPLDPLDHFILARLENEGLTPVGDADRYTWLRRVSFDLTGLPPSVTQIRAFIADTAPDAHERVVDRLLKTRAFGERWARHWLDLVGYADQIGTSNNVFAGVKPGLTHGATDDHGYLPVSGAVHLHDLHATILHLLGIDHEELTWQHAGRDLRLTDVFGNVVHDILA